MTALTSDRHNSSSMAVFLSLMAKFREKQDEASFIMSTIDVTNGLGPFRVADHIESLGDAMKLLRSMAVTLGSITRNHSTLITSDVITSLTADLNDLVSRRQICFRDLDEKSETRQAGDIDPDSDATEFVPPVAPSEVDNVANADISDLANEPEEIAAAAKVVVPSGFHGEVRTPAVEEAPEEVIAVQAANTETSAAVKPLNSVSGLVNIFEKKHTAVLQIPGVKGTMNHTYRPTHSREGHAESCDSPKLRQNRVKVRDPPWHKPVVSVVSTAVEDKMLRQETWASAPKPKNEKTAKAFSSTRFKRLLDLNMEEMMPSLGSSFSTTEMAHMLMRMSLLLMFTVSTPESANNLYR